MDSKIPSALRTRIAPTPTGFLHFGNAFSFVLTWLIARKHNGSVLLRIDDLDAARRRPEYIEDIFTCLDWLGLDYDGGPQGPDDFEATYSQRHRLDLYQVELVKLRQAGNLFACDCTRRTIKRDSPDGLHPKSCRQQNLGLDDDDVAWRIATEPNTPVTWQDADHVRRFVELHSAMRDFVVRRRDRTPAYQIASVTDDIHLGVNYIVRGQDLLESTAAQLWLASRLGTDVFSKIEFLHHSIIPDNKGGKLSKSAGATSLRAIRDTDTTPENLYRQLSPLLGLSAVATCAADALAMWT